MTVEEHLNYLSFNITNWKSEGERELSEKRCVWDWIKYNIGMHAIRYSKEKAKQRNDKEKMINQEYKETTRRFEKDPSDYNRSLLNEIKKRNWNYLMKRKQMELLFVQELASISTEKEALNTF